MQADATQLLCLKVLLNKFVDSTELKVNFNKSSIIPINMADSKMATFAAALRCQAGSLPFTYLGLPMKTVNQKCRT
jgi:hypothetical protein